MDHITSEIQEKIDGFHMRYAGRVKPLYLVLNIEAYKELYQYLISLGIPREYGSDVKYQGLTLVCMDGIYKRVSVVADPHSTFLNSL